MRLRPSLAVILLSVVSSFAAESTYEVKIKNQGHATYVKQAQTTGLRGLENCIQPTTINDVTIYQCVGTKELPARITVGIVGQKKISIYDRPPYKLGDGPDMFAIEQTIGGTNAVYVFSLENGTGSTAPLFSQHEQFLQTTKNTDKRLHYFLALNGCDEQIMKKNANQVATLDDGMLAVQYGNWMLPTWVVRRKIQSHSADFEKLYLLDTLDTDAVGRALDRLSLVQNLWNSAAQQYGCLK